MSIIHSISIQNQRPGSPIGSAWKNSKGGFGITLKGKIRKEAGSPLEDVLSTELILKTKTDEYHLSLGNYAKDGNWQGNPAKLLMVPRQSKRPDRKDPAFTVFCFAKKE